MNGSPETRMRRGRTHPRRTDLTSASTGQQDRVDHTEARPDMAPSARPTDPGTSWAASRDPDGYRLRLVDRYLLTIAERGKRGATASELQTACGGEIARICRRLTDLRQVEWVRHDGERRSIHTGRWQRVYVATAKGQRRAASVVAELADGVPA